MKSDMPRQTLSLIAVLAMTACGGGGDGGTAPLPAEPLDSAKVDKGPESKRASGAPVSEVSEAL